MGYGILAHDGIGGSSGRKIFHGGITIPGEGGRDTAIAGSQSVPCNRLAFAPSICSRLGMSDGSALMSPMIIVPIAL